MKGIDQRKSSNGANDVSASWTLENTTPICSATAILVINKTSGMFIGT